MQPFLHVISCGTDRRTDILCVWRREFMNMRQVLKAVDAGELVNAWNLFLLPDKHSFAK